MAHDAASSSAEVVLEGPAEVMADDGLGRELRPLRRRSIRVARTTRKERERALLRAIDLEGAQAERPRTRAECAQGPRPCPYVACRHHLYLDVSPETGTIKLNFPELEVWELDHSCALDVADSGEHELGTTSHLLNVTRERIRQIEVAALDKLSKTRATREIGEVSVDSAGRNGP